MRVRRRWEGAWEGGGGRLCDVCTVETIDAVCANDPGLPADSSPAVSSQIPWRVVIMREQGGIDVDAFIRRPGSATCPPGARAPNPALVARAARGFPRRGASSPSSPSSPSLSSPSSWGLSSCSSGSNTGRETRLRACCDDMSELAGGSGVSGGGAK